MSIKFKAMQLPTGQDGMLLLEIDKEDPNVLDWARSFFKEKLAKERKDGLPIPLMVEVDLWKPLRTPNQWGLAMELLSRYCAKTNQDRKNVWAGVKFDTFPDIGPVGKTVKKSSADLTTTEMSKVIDYLVVKCNEAEVDLRDIWALTQNQRGGKPMQQDKQDDLVCECCGKSLNAGTDAAGNRQIAGQQAHIISKGAGGPDEDWNVCWLCTDCHLATQHQNGWRVLLLAHPEFQQRYDRAQERWAEYVKEKEEQGDLFGEGSPEELPTDFG